MQENVKKIHQISESNQDNFSRNYSKDLIRSDRFGSDRKKDIVSQIKYIFLYTAKAKAHHHICRKTV